MPRTLRIFLSSPADVAAERARVRDLLLGLARGPFVRGRLHIDVVSWDDPHAPARWTPGSRRSARSLRAAFRGRGSPDFRGDGDIGFRLVFSRPRPCSDLSRLWNSGGAPSVSL